MPVIIMPNSEKVSRKIARVAVMLLGIVAAAWVGTSFNASGPMVGLLSIVGAGIGFGGCSLVLGVCDCAKFKRTQREESRVRQDFESLYGPLLQELGGEVLEVSWKIVLSFPSRELDAAARNDPRLPGEFAGRTVRFRQ